MSKLERRYRRLLLAYPRSYRKARGDEMLGTLLESSAPGRSQPTVKDTRALILGGLKLRSGSDQRLTVADSVRLVVLLAACLDIVSQANFWFINVRGSWGYTFPSMAYSWISLTLGLLAVATVALAWTRWRATALIVTAATAVLWMFHPQGRDWTSAIEPVLALVTIALVTADPGRPRLPRAWLALPSALLVAELTTTILQATASVPPGVDYVPFILLAGTILWIIVDARPMAAVAIWITWALGGSSVYFLTWHSSFAFSTFVVGWVWESLTLIALILALVGIRQLRRQSAL
jgi:hypothetical protein